MNSRQFFKLGTLVREKRTDSKNIEYISQERLAKSLGYKNGQFISNLERGLCGVPFEKVGVLAKALNVSVDCVVNAMVEDFKISVKDSITYGSNDSV